jgi:heavy metal sensor kinase
MNTRSLGFRLTASYTGLLALLLAVFSVTTYVGLRSYLDATLRESLTKRAKEIGPLVTDITGDGAEQVAEVRSHHAPEADNGFLRIMRGDGTVLYVSDPPRDRGFDPAQVPPPPQNIGARFDRVEYLPRDHNLLISTFRVSSRDGNRFLMEVGSSDRHIREVLNELLLIFAVSFPSALAAAIAVGYALMRRALRPISEITTKAEGITSRNLSERLPTPDTGDEIEQLSLSLNCMIARLQEAFHYVNRFSADASHELRTPLTILRGELESVAQRHDLTADARETVSSALEETDRLTKITESLLMAGRLDAGEIQVERGRLDLARLAYTTAEQMRLLAEDKDIALNCAAAGRVEVDGDAARLKQVVVNLLDNAIKYTARGGSINVSVNAANGRAVLEIADTGLGIRADALPHIFERFYRADKARTRKYGGVGLGLSIAKSISKSHGGEITVESSVGQGSCFRVELPLAQT